MSQALFRSTALALPGVVEGAHHGHPDFRAHGRVIASLHPDGEHGMVRVPVAVQQQLAATLPEVFAPCNGAWGRAGCTMVKLALAPKATMNQALTEAWQFAAGLAGGAATRKTATRKASNKKAASKGRPNKRSARTKRA